MAAVPEGLPAVATTTLALGINRMRRRGAEIQERLEREYGLSLIATLPNVEYEVLLKDGTVELCENPALLPEAKFIDEIREPIVRASVITPKDYVGPVIQISLDRRGVQTKMEYLDTERVNIEFDLPLNELVVDYYDKLKSVTRGYASLDYEPTGDQQADLVKVDILLQGEQVDAFSAIVHKEKAYSYGVAMASKLRELIPRQQFKIAVQGAIGKRSGRRFHPDIVTWAEALQDLF